MIRAGLQIPNFTYPGVAPADLFERVADVAVAAEGAGFDTVFVMDHFYQLPLLGSPDQEMFEAYTLLGAIAARTNTVNLGTLVTGVTYRIPSVLAKIVTSLDVISRGRAILGIGAAWFDVEHEALGVPFPPMAERFERLEEALQICQAMFRGENPTIEGAHYQVREVFNSPAPVRPGGPPTLIGGSGERKTMRLMAQYASMANLISGYTELPHKLEVLARHCDDAGRDPSTLNKTPLLSLFVAPTMEEAAALRDGLLQARGMPTWDRLDDATRTMVGDRMVTGDPDAAAERLRAFLDLGLDGLVVNLPASAADTDAVALAGQVVAAAHAG